jgi:hypothetical protein
MTYLHKVITEEGDMNKAATAVKWLTWLVEEEMVEDTDRRVEWAQTLDAVRSSVQSSIKERGLGKLKL